MKLTQGRMSVWPRLMFLLVIPAILVGCGGSESPTPEDPSSQLFRFAVSMDDGFYYEVQGPHAGYAAGEEYQLEARLYNPHSEPTSVDYCVLLLPQSGALARLGAATFMVDATSWADETIGIQMPDGLDLGPYGIAIIIPGRNSVVNTIWAGPSGLEQDIPGSEQINLPSHPLCSTSATAP